MYYEKEAKESLLTLKYGNALLEILPAVGGCITRYCLETEKQILELLRPATLVGLTAKDTQEMASFPLIPFSNCIRNSSFLFHGQEIN